MYNDSQRALSLRELTSYKPDIIEMCAMMEDLVNLPHRSHVIVAATFLDNALQAAISASFTNKSDAIFDNRGNLSSFFSKINIAWAMGLISKDEKEDIDTIRLLRNAFAHGPLNMDFDYVAIKERCFSLNLHNAEKWKSDTEAFDPNSNIREIPDSIKLIDFDIVTVDDYGLTGMGISLLKEDDARARFHNTAYINIFSLFSKTIGREGRS
ncbi:hypothetical protein IHQ68_11225 [Chelatococcus sambhunathii]|uniref:Mannitol repressor n=1 Tax=Chelatococcus sambhunathii TaxID=363953 RepID=A0ABU1DH10_9HYPH|nr:hypothetical protein [Chelatococcus sambhunathii]MDR4307190.1 hypothetical protein [Chelatococcus sambhunathii]